MGRNKISPRFKRVPTSFACQPVTLKDIETVKKGLGVSQSKAIEILVCKGITQYMTQHTQEE